MGSGSHLLRRRHGGSNERERRRVRAGGQGPGRRNGSERPIPGHDARGGPRPARGVAGLRPRSRTLRGDLASGASREGDEEEPRQASISSCRGSRRDRRARGAPRGDSRPPEAASSAFRSRVGQAAQCHSGEALDDGGKAAFVTCVGGHVADGRRGGRRRPREGRRGRDPGREANPLDGIAGHREDPANRDDTAQALDQRETRRIHHDAAPSPPHRAAAGRPDVSAGRHRLSA